jgi:hypothetical protein
VVITTAGGAAKVTMPRLGADIAMTIAPMISSSP